MYSLRTTAKAFALLLLLSVAGLAQSTVVSGRVVRVIDGDTVVLREAGGTESKVRLQGIDAPELDQPYGEDAKKHLTLLALDKEVAAECPKKDQYGRLVCKVTSINQTDIAQAMLWGGLAWHYKFYQNEQAQGDRAKYASAEDFARVAKSGLWADGGAVAPWDYRRAKKNVNEEVAGTDDGRPATGQEVTSAGAVLGNRRSGIYHWPGCPNYSDISTDNRVAFSTREDAERAGYRPAKNCKDVPAEAGGVPAAQPSTGSGGTVDVKGYYRKDGTYVQPHTRRTPRKKN